MDPEMMRQQTQSGTRPTLEVRGVGGTPLLHQESPQKDPHHPNPDPRAPVELGAVEVMVDKAVQGMVIEAHRTRVRPTRTPTQDDPGAIRAGSNLKLLPRTS